MCIDAEIGGCAALPVGGCVDSLNLNCVSEPTASATGRAADATGYCSCLGGCRISASSTPFEDVVISLEFSEIIVICGAECELLRAARLQLQLAVLRVKKVDDFVQIFP